MSDNITKGQFEAYVKVQRSGITNMFAIDEVEAFTGLTRKEILTIMNNYGELKKRYPDVVRAI